MATVRYKYSAISRNFRRFCDRNNISYEDMLYGCCEGRISNFPRWYCDYLKYIKHEIRKRIKTGIAHKIDVYDVWS